MLLIFNSVETMTVVLMDTKEVMVISRNKQKDMYQKMHFLKR